MKEYTFYQEQMHTIRLRDEFVVKADSLEEATQKIEFLKDRYVADNIELGITSGGAEILIDTITPMDTDLNANGATIEIYNEEWELCYSNK